MTRTASGALAIGAPMSTVRIANEVHHANESDHAVQLITSTEEGMFALNRFLRRMGCDPDAMDAKDKVAYALQHEAKFVLWLAGTSWAFRFVNP